ncbi:MAG: hypothetical protein GC155_03665 [Alphaproteobacteria bacterium]|nr:hypothetical protein [Alphaproteobacteria bacterium]
MLIAHCSIPADNPQSAAQVLAEIMQGEAVRFPPAGPHAWMAWSGDGEVEFEVVPRGATLHYDPEEGAWREDESAGRRSEVHVAVCVNRPETEIIAIAKRAGWPARHCERGGGYFSLAEVWVDGVFMIEFLDPAQTAVYKKRVTARNWKAKLVEMGVV